MAGTNAQEPGFGILGWYASASREASKAVVASPAAQGAQTKGAVCFVSCMSTDAAQDYLFVYDGQDSTGTLIAGPIPVPSNGVGSFELLHGVKFSKGLFVGLSTSATAFVAAGAVGWFNVGWRPLA